VTEKSSSGSKGSTEGGDGGEPSRSYSGWIVAVALVVGVLLGILFAAVISSFVGGSGDGNNGAAHAVPSAVASQQHSDLSTTQRQDELRANEAPESRDVRVFGCGTDPRGYASAQVLITNSGARAASYYARVIFSSATNGRTISDDVASVKHLLPGHSGPIQSVNAVTAAPGETVLCRLGSVSRF
jgi:hypothetical protein